ncbi:MAG: hypothetical protein J7L90_04395, partial [Dehalococcoidia bacterium]|nr:hypothetical protein [Dehalococcoidia bacterium]
GKREIDVFVVGVQRNLVNAVIDTLKQAGIKPYIMGLRPLSLARAANCGNALIVDLEPGHFDIILVAGGVPAIIHTVTPRSELATLEDNIRGLTNELTKAMDFYNNGHPEEPVKSTTPLFLTGELSTDDIATELIRTETGYPLETLKAPLLFPDQFPAALYAANMGLVLKKVPCRDASQRDAISFCNVNINVLDDRSEAQTRQVSTRSALLVTILIIAVVCVFPLRQKNSDAFVEVVRLQTEFGAAARNLRQARSAVAEAEQVENTIEEILSDVEMIEIEHQDILGGGKDFSSNLQLVSDILTPGAQLVSMEMDTEQIVVEGETDSPVSVVNYAAALGAREEFSEVRIDTMEFSQSDEDEGAELADKRISFKIIIDKHI